MNKHSRFLCTLPKRNRVGLNRFLVLRLFMLVISGMICGTLLSSCNAGNSVRGSISAKECTIKIGILVPQSGDQKDIASEQLSGYQMAVSEVEKDTLPNGCTLKFLYRDDQDDPEVARRETQKFILEDQVALIIGGYSSEATLVAAMEANKANVPILVPNATSTVITDMSMENVFRMNANVTSYAGIALDFIQSQVKEGYIPHLGLIYDRTFTGFSTGMTLLNSARQRGIPIAASEKFIPKHADFSTIIRRVDSSGANIVFLSISQLEDAIQILDEIKHSFKRKIWLFGIAGAFSSEKILDYTSNLNNLVIGTQWNNQVPWQDENGQDASGFIASYEQFTKKKPSTRSVFSYTAIKIAAQVVGNLEVDEKMKQKVRQDIRSSLTITDFPKTLIGPVKFNGTGQNEHPVLLCQVIDGVIQTIYPKNIKNVEVILPGLP